MKVQRKVLSAVLFLFVFSLIACSEKPESASTEKIMLEGIFSNRPVEEQNFVGVILLSTPALLNTATRDAKGKITVDEDVKNAIVEEQKQVLAHLKKAAPKAQVIYTYRLLLNGFAISAPAGSVQDLAKIPGVTLISSSSGFARPMANPTSAVFAPGDVTSVNFIGADLVHKLGITGKGLRVGIIDTGIDYTHAMLGGAGVSDVFKSVNPDLPSPLFPNAKVVGGYDFAGTSFNAASQIQENRVPRPDSNPIDEGGHGTHVAGTVAGLKVDDTSYAGVAPEAALYALKVFGKEGSTTDSTVVAALEYAADPNQDLDTSDRLDVVNLSLGGGFGAAHNLYQEAVSLLSRGGTIVVASAGNSGDVPYIVGSPSTADKAFSIAASIDGMNHNWQFKASKVIFSHSEKLVKAVEGSVSKPISEAGNVKGQFVDIGLADKELSEEVKKQLNGQIALIARGKIPFADKIKFAEANGAIGAVIYNNAEGDAFPMGGEGENNIPAIMISLENGKLILAAMKAKAVSFEFDSGQKIQEPELIDTITDFSSKGPRSEDNLLKPEISAPGQSIVSAKMGAGREVVPMSGTSMSGPHMAGVMTLLKQAHPTLTSDELKSLAMGTAKPMVDAKKVPYLLSRQGVGRVQTLEAVQSPLAFEPASISLGLVQIRQEKSLRHKTRVKNITNQKQVIKVQFNGPSDMTYQGPKQIILDAGKETFIEGIVTLSPQKPNISEWNASLSLEYANGKQVRIPVIAMMAELTEIKAKSLKVLASNEVEGRGAAALLTLENDSPVSGIAIPMNIIAMDPREHVPAAPYNWKNQSCDLQSVGYRIIERSGEQILQFGFKLYTPVTTWDGCELSVLIDGNDDGIPDQELAGMNLSNLQSDLPSKFATLLLDTTKARKIRQTFEEELRKDPKAKLDYSPAIIANGELKSFNLSTFAITEIPLQNVKRNSSGVLRIKIASLSVDQESAATPEDYLFGKAQNWKKIEVDADVQAFRDLPEEITVPGLSTETVTFSRGQRKDNLVLYSPRNAFNSSRLQKDNQQELVKTQYSKNK